MEKVSQLWSSNNGGICHGPLRSSPYAIVKASFVCIIAAIGVCQEQSIDAPSIQELSEIYPVLQRSFCS